jgi:hypothetical protein
MSQIIKLRRSAVQGKLPTTSSLDLGELAINTYDGKLYLKRDDGAESIQTILVTNSQTTGSIDLVGDIQVTGSVYVSSSVTINDYTLPSQDGTVKQIIITDGLGNLDFDFLRTVYEEVKNVSGGFLAKGTPVHVTSSVGNTNEVIAASASVPDTMPATFILDQDLNDQEEGLGIVIGFINGVNTTPFKEGQVVYVGENGGYTGTKPTGSSLIQNLGVVTKVAVNGSGIVLGAGRSNDVPNLLNGEIFFGEGNVAVRKPIADILSGSSYVFSGSFSGSFEGDANLTGTISTASYVDFTNIDNKPTLVSSSVQVDVTQTTNYDQVVTVSGSQIIYGDKTFNGLQTFNDIAVNGTASIGYLQTVTGSAKIIGDAFIILNNNVPAEPKAGIIVIDSGSTGVTSSFFWDGDTDDWKYEYNVGEDHEGAVALFGPEGSGSSNTFPYPTLNYILKSDGKHHLLDSQISDDGTYVHISNSLVVTGSITGSLLGTASTASYVDFTDIDNKPTLLSGSQQIATDISGAFTDVSSSIASDIDDLQSDSGSFSTRVTDLETFSSSLDNTEYIYSGSFSGSFVGDGSNITNVQTSSFAITASYAENAGIDTGSFVITGSVNINTLTFTKGDGSSFDLIISQTGSVESASFALFAQTASYVEYGNVANKPTLVSSSAQIATDISGAFTDVSTSLASDRLKNTTDTLTGDLTVTGKITAQEFYTEFVSSSIIYESGSTKFGDTQDDTHDFTGSVNISGSVKVSNDLEIQGNSIFTSITGSSFTGSFEGIHTTNGVDVRDDALAFAIALG